jgi:hypothetical protein
VPSLTLDDKNFIDVLKGNPIVFVKFYTSWWVFKLFKTFRLYFSSIFL